MRFQRLALAALAAASLGAAGCTAGAGSASPASQANGGIHHHPTTAPAPSVATTPATSLPAPQHVDPGTLPQTAALPSARSPAFRSRMAALWRGIVTGRPGPALAAFFPRPAYLRMKRGRIPDPASDYRSRLIVDYGLDIAAAHRLLGASAAADTFVRVAVPPQSAWIPPGVCENGIGYWHVPGSRLIYRDSAGPASIGVSSLISWRGQWYVVHLAVNGDAGTVDAPARGLGSFGAAGGC